MTNSKVVITGMSMLSPFGFGVPAFEVALKNGQSAIRLIDDTHPQESQILSVAAFLSAPDFIKNLDTIPCEPLFKQHYKQLTARAPLTLQTALWTALDVYQQAGLFSIVKTDRVGIVVTGNNTTVKQSHEQYLIYQDNPNYVSPRYGLNFLDSSYIGYISELLNIHGEGQVVGASSASGNMAIIHAMRLLEQKVLDYCLVVGVMADLSVVELQAFRQLGALGGIQFKTEPAKASRPFDTQHEGFIPGQAGACLVLERQDTAKARNARIFGYVLGSAIVLDGNHSSDPSLNGEVEVMKKAIHQAQLQSSDIDYVNAHGTSSVLGDEIEAQAFLTLFKNMTQSPWINSTKSHIGHCLWSAGIVETIATVLQLNAGFLHANLNLETPLETDVRWVGTTAIKTDCNIALSNAFAFGGINTSIILKKGECDERRY